MQDTKNNTTRTICNQNTPFHELPAGVYKFDETDDDIVNGRSHYLVTCSVNSLINQETLAAAFNFLSFVEPEIILHWAQFFFMTNFLLDDDHDLEQYDKEQISLLSNFLSKLNLLDKLTLKKELAEYVKR